ncbi:MAG: hypothetical protein HGB10_00165 [Coriobacteriia bacterium]|nr:hypothetical protein [Coriobacteriia bacterium]
MALLVVGLIAGIGYMNIAGEKANSGDPDSPVVVVLESRAEDGATVAGLIGLVDASGVTAISPDTSVTVPGTTYERLGDAFVFGGGNAVADAMSDAGKGDVGQYVTVPERLWVEAVDRVGGLRMTVPTRMSVFDGSNLATVRSGEQTLSGTELRTVVRGLGYLDAAQAEQLRRVAILGIAAAVADAKVEVSSVQSNMKTPLLATWMSVQLPQSVISQVK